MRDVITQLVLLFLRFEIVHFKNPLDVVFQINSTFVDLNFFRFKFRVFQKISNQSVQMFSTGFGHIEDFTCLLSLGAE